MMKILRACMIGLLVTICAVAAVVVLIHFGGNGDSDSAQPRDRIGNNADIDMPEIGDPIIEEDEWDEYRFWQRAATRSQETGYWQYYPIIPWNALPGETVVLSVSAVGFIGWEADSNYAPVEFFDEKTDRENAYVSFIMPDDRVSIAALYEDSIPSINFENSQKMVSAMNSMHEQGAVPVATSIVIPRPGDPYQLDPVTLGNLFYIEFSDPELPELPEGSPYLGLDLCWHWDFPSPALDGFNWIPYVHGGGQLSGVPETIGGPRIFSVTIRYCASPNDLGHIPGGVAGVFWFRITIRPDTGDPTIAITDFIPDAMVDVWYNAQIETSNFAPDSIWTWEVSRGTGLPDGLSMWVDPSDVSRWAIRGTPTTAALTGSSGSNYNFWIDMHQSFPDARTIPSNELKMKVWPQPIIVQTETVLLPGIANINGVVKPYNDLANNTPISVSYTGPPADNPLNKPNANWEWVISAGTLPVGLSIDADSTLPNTAHIKGEPTVPGNRTFTVRYMADTTVLHGWVEREYSINILQPPWFDMDSFRFADGMEDKPISATDEPDEPDDWYNEPIKMAGFPAGTRWAWSVSAGTQPSSFGLGFRPAPGNINELTTGATTFQHNIDLYGKPHFDARGDYKFTLEMECVDTRNPNIEGAKVTQEFEIKIWPRTYLHISMLGIGNRGYVRRDNFNPGDGSGDPNWAGLNMWNASQAGLYEGRRAVMPGTRAIVSTNSSGAFVRWEISPSYDRSGADLETPPVYSAGSLRASIGGPVPINAAGVHTGTGYGTFQRQHGYVVITMPSNVAVPAVRNDYDGHVYIRAEQVGEGRPVITGSPLRQGTENAPYDAAITIARNDIGNGPQQMRWEIIPGRGERPPGLYIDEYASNRTEIEGIPTQEGSFDFWVGITLPGTMRIERQYNIIINPWDGLGDVDGKDGVDLRDLVLLVRWQDDKSLNINIRNARLSTNGSPDCPPTCCSGDHVPGMADIRLLARYFTHSQGSFRPQN